MYLHFWISDFFKWQSIYMFSFWVIERSCWYISLRTHQICRNVNSYHRSIKYHLIYLEYEQDLWTGHSYFFCVSLSLENQTRYRPSWVLILSSHYVTYALLYYLEHKPLNRVSVWFEYFFWGSSYHETRVYPPFSSANVCTLLEVWLLFFIHAVHGFFFCFCKFLWSFLVELTLEYGNLAISFCWTF